jgi:hypothetical protein
MSVVRPSFRHGCSAPREIRFASRWRTRRLVLRVFWAVALVSGPGYGQEVGSAAPGAVASPLIEDGSAVVSPLTVRMVSRLVADGFMDVAAVQKGSRIAVRFQNTRYRDRRTALGAAAALARAEIPSGTELVLVVTDAGIPLLRATYPPAVGRADADAATRPRIVLRTDGVPADLLSVPRSMPSDRRVDLVVHPWFQANFSNGNAVAARTGIAPQARVTLLRGLTFSAQALITLQDDVPTGESRVRPGWITLNQRLRLWDAVLVSATAGSFNPDRYGVDVEARAYSPDGRFSAGAEVALTGAAVYGAHDWYYTPVRDPMALADVAWRELAHGLTVRMTGGWFTPGEPSLRLDVARQWGTTEVGFFAVQGETEANFGFRLVVPLPGARYGRLGSFRMRPAETFPWEYRYHTRSAGGRMFRTGSAIDDEVRQWMAP